MAEMPEADRRILEEVDFLRDKYFTYDLPVSFKGLTLYPVSVRDYNEFLSCSSCLTLNKNDDINGIGKTHIDYLISKMQDKSQGPIWSLKFTRIIELALHIPSGLKCPKCNKIMSFEEFYMKYNNPKITNKDSILECECGGQFKETISFKEGKNGRTVFILDGIEINSQDFNKLRKYIMYQNLPDYKDDSWVDKSIRDDQAAKAELTTRGMGTATLERKIVGLCAQLHWTIEQVMSLSIRKFLMLLNMIDDIMNYQIIRTGLTSGFAKLPKGETIDHWLYKKDKGMYGKAMDIDTYKSQIK